MTSLASLSKSSPLMESITQRRFLISSSKPESLSDRWYESRSILTRSGGMPGDPTMGLPKIADKIADHAAHGVILIERGLRRGVGQ